MKTDHRQNIEMAWDSLLASISEASKDAQQTLKPSPSQKELIVRLETLHLALRGLSNAWTPICSLLPAEAEDAADTSDVPGALPESAYWKPLAKALRELGCSARAKDAVAAVGKAMAKKLKAIDKEPFPGGQVRWVNRTYFARQRLKEHGLISNVSEHGVWKLTDAGIRWADNPQMTDLISAVPQDDPRQQVLPI